jgi:hypothetical protein
MSFFKPSRPHLQFSICSVFRCSTACPSEPMSSLFFSFILSFFQFYVECVGIQKASKVLKADQFFLSRIFCFDHLILLYGAARRLPSIRCNSLLSATCSGLALETSKVPVQCLFAQESVMVNLLRVPKYVRVSETQNLPKNTRI